MANVEFTAQTEMSAVVIVLIAAVLTTMTLTLGGYLLSQRKKRSILMLALGIFGIYALTQSWPTNLDVSSRQVVDQIETQLDVQWIAGETLNLQNERAFMLEVDGDLRVCRAEMLGGTKVGETIELLVECTGEELQYKPLPAKR